MIPKFIKRRMLAKFSPRYPNGGPSEELDTREESDHDLQVEEYAEAQLITSKVINSDLMHLPCIDIDHDCALVESSTPGKHHLYINRAITWDNYVTILDALVQAGIVERGYVAASKKKGYTAVRPPMKMCQHNLDECHIPEDTKKKMMLEQEADF